MDPSNPVGGNPDLTVIEAKLTSGVTLVLPAPTTPTPKTLATDLQLAAALAAAVDEELTSGIANVTVESLVREAAQYRPDKVSRVIAPVIPVIINQGGTDRELLLEAAIGAAASAAGKGAPSVASTAIAAIVSNVGINSPGLGLSEVDDIAAAAIEASRTYAASTVAAAIKATKKASSPQAAAIASAAISAAHNVNADYLIEEITKSAVASVKGFTGVTYADVASSILDAAASNGLNSVDSVVQLVAAAMAGAGTTTQASMESMLDSKYASDASRRNSGKAAIAGFIASRSGLPEVAATQVANAINANPGEAAAITAGGVAGVPKYAQDIVARAMQVAFNSNSDDSQVSIVSAGIRANPLFTAKITAAAVDKAEELKNNNASYATTVADIAGAAVATAPIELAGMAASSAMQALNTKLDPVAVRSVVGAALDGAEASSYHQAFGDIVFRAIRANKTMSTNIVSEAIARADVGGAGDEFQTKLAAVVAGAIAADKKNITSITDAALLASDTAEGDALITKAADIAGQLILAPKDFYRLTDDALATVSSANEALAVVYGASMLNPKGATAIAAAAVSRSVGGSPVDSEAVIRAASGADWKAIPRVAVSVNVAAYVRDNKNKDNKQSELFSYVADQVVQNPTMAVDIATGATVAAPEYAHVTAHATAFRSPKGVSKAIPAIFAFSKMYQKNTGGVDADQPARAAAIMAGATNGILEAKLTSATELASIRSAVSAAVKASLLLRGPFIATVDRSNVLSTSPTGSSKQSVGAAGVVTGYISQVVGVGETDIQAATVKAVLTAAGATAKNYILEIAQAAAQAAAAISGAPQFYVGNGIVSALLLSKSVYTENEIRNAVRFGIQQAANGVVGAGAAGVRNYAFSAGTGTPVTSIFDL